MKSPLILICTVMALCTSQAQVSVSDQESKRIDRSIFGLGFSAGVASGFGLSFRHHLPGQFSYQMVGGIVKVDAKTHYNVGSEMQFDLINGEAARFFACGAVGYFHSSESGNNELSGPFRMGLGIGVEKGASRTLHLAAELLFTYFSDGTVLPLPQIGIYYYFF